jgi:uncharacterized membrane protein
MPDDLMFAVRFVTTIGCGLMAGLFFAFSVAVMRGLGRIPAAHGLSAMQAINIAIINPWFLAVFIGTGVLSAVVVIMAMLRSNEPGATSFIVGGMLYLVGAILVTGLCNVPMNNAIAPLDGQSPESARRWQDYLKRWTAWNHIRTIATLAATVAMTVGLMAGRVAP